MATTRQIARADQRACRARSNRRARKPSVTNQACATPPEGTPGFAHPVRFKPIAEHWRWSNPRGPGRKSAGRPPRPELRNWSGDVTDVRRGPTPTRPATGDERSEACFTRFPPGTRASPATPSYGAVRRGTRRTRRGRRGGSPRCSIRPCTRMYRVKPISTPLRSRGCGNASLSHPNAPTEVRGLDNAQTGARPAVSAAQAAGPSGSAP